MNKMNNASKKRFLLSFVIILFSLAFINAGTISMSKTPELNVSWIFDGNRELFNVGFSLELPVVSQNMSWNFINDTSSLELKDRFDNNAVNHKADASVYAYWALYSNSSVTVSLSASGPMIADKVTDNTNYSNQINWQASWQPMVVSVDGLVVPSAGDTETIGRLDNVFTSPSDYTDHKALFTQVAANYPIKSRYGFAKIDIETQNTKSSDIAKGSEKVRGNYYCSLYLDVVAR